MLLNMPTLQQMKKPRPEEMKGLAQGHPVNRRAGTRIKYPISKMIESSQAVCPSAWSCRGAEAAGKESS